MEVEIKLDESKEYIEKIVDELAELFDNSEFYSGIKETSVESATGQTCKGYSLVIVKAGD